MRLRSILVIAIVSALSCATPAAARYGYCSAFQKNAASFGPADSQYPLIHSGILDFGDKNENYGESGNQFRVFLFNNSVTCDGSYNTVKDAETAKKRRMDFSQGHDKDTGWTGSFAAIGDAKPDPVASGAFISIKDNGIAARTKAWDDAVLQSQREAAQRRVSQAASTSVNDPRIKALIAAEMDKMRKRGRKQ